MYLHSKVYYITFWDCLIVMTECCMSACRITEPTTHRSPPWTTRLGLLARTDGVVRGLRWASL